MKESKICKCPLCGGNLGTIVKLPHQKWNQEYTAVLACHDMPMVNIQNYGELWAEAPYLISKPWNVIKWELLHPILNSDLEEHLESKETNTLNAPIYDTTKLAESIEHYGSLAEAKRVMLENIVGIASAVYDRDTERAMMIQNNLMGAYDIINAIKEKEVSDE